MRGPGPPKRSLHVLVMLDNDHFKRVNDAHSDPVSYRVLKGLLKCCAACQHDLA